MKFEHTSINGFEAALRGMRAPRESWSRSDSFFGLTNLDKYQEQKEKIVKDWVDYSDNLNCLSSYSLGYEEKKVERDRWLQKNGILEQTLTEMVVAFIGPKDMRLAKQLVDSGPEHRKFLRQINVSVDITAPLYVWKELDTYKVGTAANSTSTMHTLANTPITIDNFETDDYKPDLPIDVSPFDGEILWEVKDNIKDYLDFLNTLREKYVETNDTRYWKELVRWLPESWLQTRTWSANYEVLYNISRQRMFHKLTEWHTFIDWVKTLPYADDLILNKI